MNMQSGSTQRFQPLNSRPSLLGQTMFMAIAKADTRCLKLFTVENSICNVYALERLE